MDYHYVEQLFDMMVVDYYRDKPPPEEPDTHGEWVKVRDGLQGVEHCIRVLTPEEFDEWHRCLELPLQVEPGRKPVAYCNHEGVWWVIYEDSDESEVITRFEKCFEGGTNMTLQNYEKKRTALVEKFKAKMSARPPAKDERIKLSWSNWGFGMEPLEATAARLHKNKIHWIELHGNRYGADLGYKPAHVMETLGKFDIRVAGVCGMFGPENDLSSNSGIVRQRAVDYIRRQLDLCHCTGGSYLLVVPGAVGRPTPYDDSEFERSVETLRLVADDFVKAGIRAAVEPIRSAEVSLIHTVRNAKRYIAAVGYPGIGHINGDVYHMQVEEANIAEAILDADSALINLHLADSNRCALGSGSMDVDAIIMALYAIGYTEGLRFATPEPLGPGGAPYPAMFGKPDAALLDSLVAQTAAYWRAREEELRSFASIS